MSHTFNDELTQIYKIPTPDLLQKALESSRYDVVEGILASGFITNITPRALVRVVMNLDLTMLKLLDSYGLLRSFNPEHIYDALNDNLEAKKDLGLIDLPMYDKIRKNIDNLRFCVNK
jgi:hypothetical protein